MRSLRLIFILAVLTIGGSYIHLVMAQDTPPATPAVPTLDLSAMPNVPVEDIDIPMPPVPTEEPICITGKDGQTYCQYPTMSPCYTSSNGQTLCTYPTMIPTSTPNSPTLTPDASRIVPGFWRQTRSQTTIIGTCKAMGVGHNPGGGGDSPTPVIPLTPIYQSSTADFLFINDYPYPLVQPQLYSTTTTSRELNLQTGASSGSIKTSTTTEYQIVASDLIAIHNIYKEEGGCAIESSSKYELVRTDPSVVKVTVDDIATLQPTLTAIVEGTPIPPEQPIPPGTYPVTWTVDSGTCTDKTQPTFTQAKIDYTNNGDMLLRLGNDEHTLFPVGSDDNIRYQLISSERQITVQVLSGVIKMDWGKFASVTNMCFKSGELGISTTATTTASPFIDPTATPIAAAGSQQYQINFKPDEQMCPSDIQKKLPAFDGATFEALPNGGYQLIVGDETYIFNDNSGYSIYDGSDPKKGITYQIAVAFANNQGGQLGLTYMNASGAFCLAEMSLSPK